MNDVSMTPCHHFQIAVVLNSVSSLYRDVASFYHAKPNPPPLIISTCPTCGGMRELHNDLLET